MKECLVIALMLSLTGMVVGQQSDPLSNFDTTRTDSTRVTSPSPDLSSSRAPRADGVDRIMKLDIDTGMIDAIKGGQSLTAKIDLKDVTNGIVMLFDDPKALKPRVDEVPRNLKPDFVSGNGVLHFTLDEEGLERLRTEGLQYEYQPGEKGTYQEVELKFVPSNGTPANTRPPIASRPTDFPSRLNPLPAAGDKEFGSNRRGPVLPDNRRGPALPDTSRRLDTDRTLATGRERLSRNDFGSADARTNRNFSANSTKTTDTEADRYFEQQRLLKSQQELDRQRQTELSRTSANDQFRDDRNPNWNSSRLNQTPQYGSDKHTFELSDQEIDALAMSTQQIRDERTRREAEVDRLRRENLEADQLAQRANADRLRLLQELRDRNSRDQTTVARRRDLNDKEFYTSYGQRTLLPASGNLSRTVSRDSQYDPVRSDLYADRLDSPTVASDAAQVKLQAAALENDLLRRRLALAQTDRTTLAAQQRLADLTDNGVDPRNTSYDNTNARPPLRMSDFGASIPGSQPPNGNRPPRNDVPQTLNRISTNHLMTETAVDGILRSYDGGHLNTNFDQVANRVRGEVAAISAAKTRVDKFNGFLLFLFITFFALSLYLGWLAQSFYGQYGELADELRETFTATT